MPLAGAVYGIAIGRRPPTEGPELPYPIGARYLPRAAGMRRLDGESPAVVWLLPASVVPGRDHAPPDRAVRRAVIRNSEA
jgi:hypothetical protein